MFRAIVLFGLCSVLCDVSAQINLADSVQSVVVNTNRYIKENHIDRLNLPDFSDNGPLHELQIRNTKMGNFSTTEVKEIPFVNMTETDGSKLYRFDVVLGLHPAEISYDFQLTIEGLFPMSGNVVVKAYKNSYEVRGTVLTKPDGTCQAVLESCKFKELKDFKVDIKPRSVSYISSAKKYLLDVMTPHYIPRINAGMGDVIQKDKFQTVFASIVCTNLKK